MASWGEVATPKVARVVTANARIEQDQIGSMHLSAKHCERFEVAVVSRETEDVARAGAIGDL